MKKHIIYLFLLISLICNSQNPGDVAQSFGVYNGFDANISVITVQNDGKILLGGYFSTYNGSNERRIIRLNSDGTKDNSFITGNGFAFGNTINSIIVQNDGKIIVGGLFSTYQGISKNNIIRLNPDGSIDETFIIGNGFDDQVNSIVLQNDGKIIIGGSFTTYQGVTVNRIVRLNPDGTIDAGFNTAIGFDAYVSNVSLQNDGKILVGGAFTSYNGITEGRIIRLNQDGSKDTSFISGTGFNGGGVTSLIVQNDGKILVGGGFTSYNGITEGRIIRLNQDGSKDTSFITGTGFITDVYDIKIQNDGKILVGGAFTSYNGTTEGRIIRLNANGSKDDSFVSGTGFNSMCCVNTTVNSIAIQNDSNILVGGEFATYQGDTEMYMIRLNSNGTKNTSFYSGNGFIGSQICDMAFQPDGKILVGGWFHKYNGILENNFIRLNIDGTKDISFITGSGFDRSVSKIIIQNDGKILVAGNFATYQGVVSPSVIRINSDGSIDSSFNIGNLFTSPVYDIKLQNDGKILVVSEFGSLSIKRLNSNGSIDSSFITGTGFNSIVNTIAIQNDGKILVGGFFTTYKGVLAKRIIRLNSDGSKDSSFITGTGFNATVLDIKIQNDGKILVGGDFSAYQGVSAKRIIRLNTDGSIDSSFNTGLGFDGYVNTIVLQNDGNILVGGAFATYQGVTAKKIIRLNTDGSIDSSFISGSGFIGNFINRIVLKNDNEILVGGNFTTYQDNYFSSDLIKLHGNLLLNNESINLSKENLFYPNPAKDQITIDFGNTSNIINWKYRIVTMLGQEVQNGILNSQQNIIQLRSIKNEGIYFVEIYDSLNKLMNTKKIIFQK